MDLNYAACRNYYIERRLEYLRGKLNMQIIKSDEYNSAGERRC